MALMRARTATADTADLTRSAVGRRLVAGTLLSTVAAGGAIAFGPGAQAAGKGPEVIAHRGGLDWGTENSLRTITHAFATGADAVEFDIQFTKDLRTVVMHDTTMNRTTNCTGTVTRITYRKFRSCKLDGDGSTPPNIYEALLAVRDANKKAYIHLRAVDSATKARKVLRAVKKYGLNDGRAVIISAEEKQLARTKRAGATRHGLLFRDPAKWAANYSYLIPYADGATGLITPARVARAQQGGHKVIVVENHPTRLGDVLDLKLDGYLANGLAKALEVLRTALAEVDGQLAAQGGGARN